MINMKLNTFRFALTGGIYAAIIFASATIAGIFNIPGFIEFASFLKIFYGAYGYSITWIGVAVATLWGFVEGFFHVGLFVLIYNWLNKK